MKVMGDERTIDVVRSAALMPVLYRVNVEIWNVCFSVNTEPIVTIQNALFSTRRVLHFGVSFVKNAPGLREKWTIQISTFPCAYAWFINAHNATSHFCFLAFYPDRVKSQGVHENKDNHVFIILKIASELRALICSVQF